MKKTFTINISGSIFHIEDDAYDMLQKYLIKLKKHFGSGEEGNEIIADIEDRIAEIFIEKSTHEKMVITIDIVNEIIDIMGTPEDFAEEGGEEEPVVEEAKRKRRLYRDPDHRVLGGVSSGIAAYFNMDPVIIRIIFAALFFITSGAALLAYIILWIAVPKAKSTTQRLEMRGQEATVKNIEKSIKEEVAEVKESYQKFKESKTYSKGRRGAEEAGDVVYNVFKVLLKVIVIIIGSVLIISGFLGLLGFVSSMIVGHSFVDGWPLIWEPEIHVPGFFNHFVEPGTVTFGMIAIAVLVGIPMLAMLFIGTKLVFSYKTNNTAIGLSMVGIWLIALFSLIVVSAGQVGNFKSRTSMTENKTISCDSCQTLYLKLAADKYEDYAELDLDINNFKIMVIDGVETMMGKPSLDVVKSGSDNFIISVKKAARGSDRINAKGAAEDIIYNYEVTDSTVVFDPYFLLDEKGKWRDQNVDITIKVPEGKSVFLGENLVEIIYDIDNVSNTYDADMVGKTWEMSAEGLRLKKETESN